MGMRTNACVIVLAGSVAISCGAGPQQAVEADDPGNIEVAADLGSAVVDQTVQSLAGESVDLASFRGRPILIVNTASKCGYTPQYESLQTLYERYGEEKLVVIGFPSNDFGNQEPGKAEEIENFCRVNYGVTFPMMAKVRTKGPDQAAVYQVLTNAGEESTRGEIRWNFTKFLIDQDGRVVARFEPSVDPLDDQVVSAVDELLAASTG